MRKFQLGHQILDSCAYAGGIHCRPSCSQEVQLSCSRVRVVISASSSLQADLHSHSTTCLNRLKSVVLQGTVIPFMLHCNCATLLIQKSRCLPGPQRSAELCQPPLAWLPGAARPHCAGFVAHLQHYQMPSPGLQVVPSPSPEP